MRAVESGGEAQSTRQGSKALMWSFLMLCTMLFFGKGFLDQTRVVHCADFQPVYAGSRCLLMSCNPYDGSQIRAEFLREGGIVQGAGRQFESGSANYPPSALFLILPWALVPWEPAHIAWLIAIGISMTVATLLTADLCGDVAPWPVLAGLGIFLAGDTWLLLLGQPAGVAIGLCVFAVWSLLQRKLQAAGVICFALSLAVKPQIGALIWLYFAVESTYRRRALQILLTTSVICLPGVVWVSAMPASRHWFGHLQHVVGAIARDKNVGADADAMHFVHLQPMLQVLSERAQLIDNLVHGLILVLLLACLAVALLVGPSQLKDRFALGAIACLTLLPVYHEDYDTRLLILAFPAIGLLLLSRRLLGVLALTVVTLLGFVTSPSGYARIEKWQIAKLGTWSRGETVLFARSPAILMLILGVIMLYGLLDVIKQRSPHHPVAGA